MSSTNDDYPHNGAGGAPIDADPPERSRRGFYLLGAARALVERALAAGATWKRPTPPRAPDCDDNDDPWAVWPETEAKLKEQFTQRGRWAEPVPVQAPPPQPPALIKDGDEIPAGADDAATRPPKRKKAPSVVAEPGDADTRHKRAVLALVNAEDRGAASKRAPDPIDVASPRDLRAALKAVRRAVYGPLQTLDEAVEAEATERVWIHDAPLVLDRTAQVHDALAQYGLEVHEDNEALVAYANGAGITLMSAGDLGGLPDTVAQEGEE